MDFNKLPTLGEALKILKEKASHTDKEVMQAYLTVSLYEKRLSDVLAEEEADFTKLLGAEPVNVVGTDYNIRAEVVDASSVNLSKAHKDYMLAHPTDFKDYVGMAIIGAKVREAALAGVLSVDGSKVVPVVAKKAAVKVNIFKK